MRKINPNEVRADFDNGLAELITFYQSAKTTLKGDKDQTILAESTILSAATLWEGFINDLFVAYINRDSTQFILHLTNAMEHDRTSKQKEIANRFSTLSFPKHLTVQVITSLLDESGNNLTFSSYAALKKGQRNIWQMPTSYRCRPCPPLRERQ
ncbi:hypothetical protein LWV33_03290 [Brucella intermedia]